MAVKKSKIEWTEATWNPSIGCTKISEGCRNCYAEVFARRLQAMGAKDYESGFRFRILPHRLEEPLRRKKPTRYFVNSMSDLFHEDMPEDFLDAIMYIIRRTPQHQYQILTKRAERMHAYFSRRPVPQNIWLGVTVEHPRRLYRIDLLRQIDARIRFISFEPLLEDLGQPDLTDIHWAIVGGESGPKARPMKKEWALNIKSACERYGTEFFFKQWGTWGEDGVRRSKKKNGNLLEGRRYQSYPSV